MKHAPSILLSPLQPVQRFQGQMSGSLPWTGCGGSNFGDLRARGYRRTTHREKSKQGTRA